MQMWWLINDRALRHLSGSSCLTMENSLVSNLHFLEDGYMSLVIRPWLSLRFRLARLTLARSAAKLIMHSPIFSPGAFIEQLQFRTNIPENFTTYVPDKHPWGPHP